MSVPRSRAIRRNARKHHAHATTLTDRTLDTGFTNNAHTSKTNMAAAGLRLVRFDISGALILSFREKEVSVERSLRPRADED